MVESFSRRGDERHTGMAGNSRGWQTADDEKILYLTLDACGGGYDSGLIAFLRANNIPAAQRQA